MNPDGISYLDIASEALKSGPTALINTYWSPLYPALIAFSEWLYRPSPLSEFTYIHVLNAVIYTGTALSFAYFLRQLIRFRSASDRGTALESILIAFGFALFFRFTNADVTGFVITPDLLVAGIVFCAAGLFFRVLRGHASRRTFVVLGVVLALGYFAKSVMLPAGVVMLFMLLLWAPRWDLPRKRVLIAAVTMFLLSAPLILLISKQVGHFSVSEAGRLNYWWLADGIPLNAWAAPPGSKLVHGPRVVQQSPKVIEFSAPIPGTYPLWYEPSYWYAGVKVRLSAADQIRASKNSIHFYRSIFPDLRLPLEGLVVFLVLAYTTRSRIGHGELLFLLWPVAVLSIYALVTTEYRYAAPFLIILWMAVYSAVLTRTGEIHRILLTLLAGVMLLSSARSLVSHYHKILIFETSGAPFMTVWIPALRGQSPDRIAARELIAMGLKAGDRIATVGDGFTDFYAHMAQLRIIAEVVDPAKFWRLQSQAAVSTEQQIAKTGATWLIAADRPKEFQAGLWKEIPGTNYSVLKLQ